MTQREQVTLQQVYEIVNRLEDKVDKSYGEMRGAVTENTQSIGKIQNQIAGMRGFSAAVYAVIGGIITLVGSWIAGGGLHK